MALIREKRRLKGLGKTVMQLLGALLALMLAVSEAHTSKGKKGIKKNAPTAIGTFQGYEKILLASTLFRTPILYQFPINLNSIRNE